MENRRFILIVLLGVVLFFMYQAWQTDYAPAATAPAAQTAAPAVPEDDAPKVAADDAPKAPANPAAPAEVSAVPAAAAASGNVHIETDVLSGDIALAGGELRRLSLIGYPEFKNKPEDLALLDDRNGRWFVLQSGIAGTDAGLSAVYGAAQTSYKLADGSDTLEVPLEYKSTDGVAVRKVFTFKRGSYRIGLSQQLHAGAAELNVSPYVRFSRTSYNVGAQPRFSRTFLGVGAYEQKDPGSTSYKFSKTAYDKLGGSPIELHQTGGWLAMLQHYFIAAIIPAQDEALTFNAKPGREPGRFIGQYVGAAVKVAPQAERSFDTALYIGPQLQDSIADAAPRLDLTLDYGILTPLAKPLFWVLEKFHKYTGNWGYSIVLLTLTVKLLMIKLSEAQYRSMAKMKKFGPRIQELKERYGEDRERLQKAMMELYKKEGFNPLAGCWPLLVQMPVFFALYWVLLQSVELRQVPFALWINDLSAPDPFYVLPVLYGLSMWAQQKIQGQPATMDPMQQKMMSVMPVALTAFFTFFPSGLVLYWLASSLIGIAQQFYITRKLEREGLSTRNA